MTSKANIKLSLIIPVYNEASALPVLIDKIKSIPNIPHDSCEVIFVDDGSNDSTWETIKNMVVSSGNIRALRFTRNFGKEAAMMAGLESSKGECAVIIDADLPPLDEEIPSDRNYLHFGAGQSETRIELPPGKHTLQLLMGDHNHMPHCPPVYSRKITVYVK